MRKELEFAKKMVLICKLFRDGLLSEKEYFKVKSKLMDMPKYYVEGSHEAIIDRDVFMKVKAEIARRANLNPDGKRRVYSSKYALSGMVFCGHCGDIYRRVKWNNRGSRAN